MKVFKTKILSTIILLALRPCPLHWNRQEGKSFSLPSFDYCLGPAHQIDKRQNTKKKDRFIDAHTQEFTEKYVSRRRLEFGAYDTSQRKGEEEKGTCGKTNDFLEKINGLLA